jgi:hypothetical protein
MSVVPTTNFIDTSGGIGTLTPNSLALPQDISAIFIPYSGNYKFTNSYTGLLNATGFNYYSSSSGTFVDISNLFDTNLNPRSYTSTPFLLGYKIPYGTNGTLTDIGSIFGLINPIPPPTWSKWYWDVSGTYNTTFKFTSICMSNNGGIILAGTNNGTVSVNNTYGYDPSGNSSNIWGWSYINLISPPSYTCTTTAMSSNGSVMVAGFTSGTYNGTIQGQVFYSINSGTSWNNFVSNSINVYYGGGIMKICISNDGSVVSILTTAGTLGTYFCYKPKISSSYFFKQDMNNLVTATPPIQVSGRIQYNMTMDTTGTYVNFISNNTNIVYTTLNLSNTPTPSFSSFNYNPVSTNQSINSCVVSKYTDNNVGYGFTSNLRNGNSYLCTVSSNTFIVQSALLFTTNYGSPLLSIAIDPGKSTNYVYATNNNDSFGKIVTSSNNFANYSGFNFSSSNVINYQQTSYGFDPISVNSTIFLKSGDSTYYPGNYIACSEGGKYVAVVTNSGILVSSSYGATS